MSASWGKTWCSRILGKQLLRSGTSIGANIEEGQASQSDADFIHKYSIACKEARETHYWLRLLSATKILPAEKLSPLTQECDEIIAILTTIIKKMRNKMKEEVRREKFKAWSVKFEGAKLVCDFVLSNVKIFFTKHVGCSNKIKYTPTMNLKNSLLTDFKIY